MDIGNIIYTTIEVIIAVVAIFGNSLVLYVIYKNKPLRTITNYFVTSLATADLLVGVLGIPSALITGNGYPHNFIGCLLLSSTVIILTQISVFGLLTIAIERFYAINNPFSYHRKFTGKTAGIIILISWIAAIMMGLPPVFGWNLGPNEKNTCSFVTVIDLKYMVYFNFFGCVLTPLLIIFAIYVYIFYIVRKQSQQIASLQVANGQNATKKPLAKSETKAAKMFAVIIVIFALCWLPLHIMNSITLWTGQTNMYALWVGILLSHVNSTLNPYLYAFTNSRFKNAMKRALGIRISEQDLTVVIPGSVV